MGGYGDLKAWQKAMDFAESVYSVTKEFPREELYGLTSQLRRAGVSVPSNIAEGWGRKSRNEYRHHLGIARGSLLEAETQVLLAGRLGYVPSVEIAPLLDQTAEVARLLNGLIKALDPDPGPCPAFFL